MLGTCALASSTVFGRVGTLKRLMYVVQGKGWIRVHPLASFEYMPEYKKRSFLSEEELQRIIHIKPRYKRQRVMRDAFLFVCFTGLSYVGSRAVTYDNIRTDSDGGTWLMGNRIKTGVVHVVRLLPITIRLIEEYRGTDEKKDSLNMSLR